MIWYGMVWYHTRSCSPLKILQLAESRGATAFPQFRRKYSPLPSEKASVKYASYSWRLAHTFVSFWTSQIMAAFQSETSLFMYLPLPATVLQCHRAMLQISAVLIRVEFGRLMCNSKRHVTMTGGKSRLESTNRWFWHFLFDVLFDVSWKICCLIFRGCTPHCNPATLQPYIFRLVGCFASNAVPGRGQGSR